MNMYKASFTRPEQCTVSKNAVKQNTRRKRMVTEDERQLVSKALKSVANLETGVLTTS